MDERFVMEVDQDLDWDHDYDYTGKRVAEQIALHIDHNPSHYVPAFR